MSQLFSPFTLRELTFKNRIFVSPMCQYSCADGVPNDWHKVHLGSRAVGGAALVMTEAASVTPAGRCPRCHNSADGAFMAGQAAPLAGYPTGVELYGPNLTPDKETGVGDWSDNQLVLAIRQGVDNESMNLCPQMVHYKTMGDDEVNAIVAFLRTIPAVKNQAPGSICPPLKSKP